MGWRESADSLRSPRRPSGARSLAETGEAEVRAFHAFFEDWFTAERDGVCLLTDEEPQRTAGSWRGRRSSALLEEAGDAPGGVVWRHLPETWLGG